MCQCCCFHSVIRGVPVLLFPHSIIQGVPVLLFPPQCYKRCACVAVSRQCYKSCTSFAVSPQCYKRCACVAVSPGTTCCVWRGWCEVCSSSTRSELTETTGDCQCSIIIVIWLHKVSLRNECVGTVSWSNADVAGYRILCLSHYGKLQCQLIHVWKERLILCS